MQKWVKNTLITAGAFVAWRLYKLWEMFNSLNWSFQSVRFTRPKLATIADSYIMTIGLKIYNQSDTTLWINSIDGLIEYDGYVLGRYQMGTTRINRGETKLEIDLNLDPKYVAAVLIPDLVNRKAPIMTLTTNATLILGIKVTNRFRFNVKNYLPEPINQIFF